MRPIPEMIQSPEFAAAFEIAGEPSWRNPLPPPADVRTDLLFVQSGRGECLIDDMIVTVSGGDLVIFPPSSRYEIISSVQTPMTGSVISLIGIALAGLPQGYLASPDIHPVVRLDKDFSSVNRFFSDILAESTHQTYGSEALIHSLVNAILVLALRKLYEVEQTVPASSITSEVKKYIEEQFNQDLTLGDLAAVVFVSPYHLAHVFKEEMGISPIQYLIRYRMEEAKRLLKSSNLSIREIASKVGYPNGIYFNLIFKKVTGIPPGKYRKKGGD